MQKAGVLGGEREQRRRLKNKVKGKVEGSGYFRSTITGM